MFHQRPVTQLAPQPPLAPHLEQIHRPASHLLAMRLCSRSSETIWPPHNTQAKPPHLPAGLMTLAAALSFGATSVTITDINPDNIKLAQKMGATNTHCHPRTATPPEIAEYLKKLLSPIGPEIVIDCVGFESTVQTAIR